MATYYIATTGNDTTGDGSQGNPWATINKFFSAGSADDTLMIEDGTYTWSTEITTLDGFTMTAVNMPTETAVARDGWNVTLDASGTGAYWGVDAGTYAFNGIRFFDNPGSANRPLFQIGTTDGTYPVTFTECYFEDCGLNSVGTSSIEGGVWGSLTIGQTYIPQYTVTGCVFDSCFDSGTSSRGQFFCLNLTSGSTNGFFTMNNSIIYIPSGLSDNIEYLTGVNAIGGSPTAATITLKNNIIRNASGASFSLNNFGSGGLGDTTWTNDGNYLNNFTFTDSVTAGASSVENSDASPLLFVSEVAGSENFHVWEDSAANGIAVQI